jgi:hypothetical protein
MGLVVLSQCLPAQTATVLSHAEFEILRPEQVSSGGCSTDRRGAEILKMIAKVGFVNGWVKSIRRLHERWNGEYWLVYLPMNQIQQMQIFSKNRIVIIRICNI